MSDKKAFICAVKNMENELGSIVVFAETRGKAIGIAVNHELFEDYCDWREVRCRRCKELDGCYRGKAAMDWNDDLDRFDMVSKAGFWCTEVDREECGRCYARDVCENYRDYLYEMKLAWCEECGCCIMVAPDPDNCEIYEAAHRKEGNGNA